MGVITSATCLPPAGAHVALVSMDWMSLWKVPADVYSSWTNSLLEKGREGEEWHVPHRLGLLGPAVSVKWQDNAIKEGR